ncbi:hypothetical protein N0V95_001708 [Ascochyta clinopodiicola]|nr:hypothetical protein N0V95_001708 [Ascochyta clinopodiicola]
MVQSAISRTHQVVDLTSDNEDDDLAHNGVAVLEAPCVEEPTESDDDWNTDQLLHGYHQHSETIDLTTVPDVDIPPSDVGSSAVEDNAPNEPTSGSELVAESVCLQLVLDIVPDVAADHVLTLIRARTTDQMRTRAHSEQIVNELLEGVYPKEADTTSKKRRRAADSDDVSEYEKDERDPGVLEYDADA